MDNLDQGIDNQDPIDDSVDGLESGNDVVNEDKSSASWKSTLDKDIAGSPLLKKFEDTPEGLSEAFKSHSNLEKLLGHEKVPIPKGPEDVEGWNIFSKALGIPDKAENYGLADPKIPDQMKDTFVSKQKFAEIMHAHKLTPAQAKGLWDTFQQQNVEGYNKALKDHETNMQNVVNQLKSKWGDAYDNNVELGQMVINKFAGNKEDADELSAALLSNPKAIEFLAKVGEQFAENKIGEFSMKRFSLSPEQAQNEIDSILKDPRHPYNDPAASEAEHTAAIDYVNSLYLTINKARG